MAEKGQAGLAHEGGCCFFPAHRAAQQLTLQGRGASLCSLSPSHSCCQLQAQHLPQKWLPASPRVGLPTCCCQDHHLSKSASPDTSKMGLEPASSDAHRESPRSPHFLMFHMFAISTKPWFWSTFVCTRCYFTLGLKIFNNFFPPEDFLRFFSVENLQHAACWDCTGHSSPGYLRGGCEPSL